MIALSLFTKPDIMIAHFFHTDGDAATVWPQIGGLHPREDNWVWIWSVRRDYRRHFRCCHQGVGHWTGQKFCFTYLFVTHCYKLFPFLLITLGISSYRVLRPLLEPGRVRNWTSQPTKTEVISKSGKSAVSWPWPLKLWLLDMWMYKHKPGKHV